MEYFLENIIPFLGHNHDINLVSKEWRAICQSIDREILATVQYKYPSYTPASSVKKALQNDDVDIISIFIQTSSNQYGINWDALLWNVSSPDMARVILPYVKKRHQPYLLHKYNLSPLGSKAEDLQYLLVLGRKEEALSLLRSLPEFPSNIRWGHSDRDTLVYLRENGIDLDIYDILDDDPLHVGYIRDRYPNILSLDAEKLYRNYKNEIKTFIFKNCPRFFNRGQFDRISDIDIISPSVRIMQDIISHTEYIHRLLDRYQKYQKRMPRILLDYILQFTSDKELRDRVLLISIERNYSDIIAYYVKYDDIIPLLSHIELERIPRAVAYINAAIPGFYDIMFSVFRGESIDDILFWRKLLVSSLATRNISLAKELIHVYNESITEENIREMYVILPSDLHYELTQVLSIYFDNFI